MWCFNIINLWISLTWNLFSMGHSQSFQTKFRSMKVFQLVQLSWEKHVFFFKLWVEMLNTTAILQVSRKCCSCICFSCQVFSEVQVVQKQLYNREIKLTFDNAFISQKIKKYCMLGVSYVHFLTMVCSPPRKIRLLVWIWQNKLFPLKARFLSSFVSLQKWTK